VRRRSDRMMSGWKMSLSTRRDQPRSGCQTSGQRGKRSGHHCPTT